jgi:hypothetical protein
MRPTKSLCVQRLLTQPAVLLTSAISDSSMPKRKRHNFQKRPPRSHGRPIRAVDEWPENLQPTYTFIYANAAEVIAQTAIGMEGSSEALAQCDTATRHLARQSCIERYLTGKDALPLPHKHSKRCSEEAVQFLVHLLVYGPRGDFVDAAILPFILAKVPEHY